MKQVLQSYGNGRTELVDVPAPSAKPGHLLIRTHVSLISAGTERMLLEFGSAGLLNKARRQPEKVRMVLDKVRTDGLLPTIEAVRSKLDLPTAMGYCNVGTVVEVGAGVTEFQIGDRVVSNGPHAEVVSVPKHLCAKIPENVQDESAVFTVLGAIALQGMRLAKPTLGESFAVLGLGLVGLMAVQLLKAQGCRVIGFDFDHRRLKLAEQFGAETFDLSGPGDPVAAALKFSRNRGIDGVLIAAATKSDTPIHQAAGMSRKRGRIVLVGVTGMQMSRADFFEKELSFQVSCSYGPGRYDSKYEEQGHDYPVGFVRWTEQRNFEAVLDMMSEKQIDCAALVSHRFPLKQVGDAYELIGGSQPSLGVILQHRSNTDRFDSPVDGRTVQLKVVSPSSTSAPSAPAVGIIGAGNFASRVLLPALRQTGANIVSIASRQGVTAVHAARKHGIPETTTDPDRIINNPAIEAIVVATRHDSHADYVCRALQAGKHVFVEKPLALNRRQLGKIVESYTQACAQGNCPLLMVGFNRRFAPHIQQAAMLLEQITAPKSFILTVNAGAIPAEHWTQDPALGGGRVVGEGCHFIDLLRFLCGHRITAVNATMIGGTDSRVDGDTLSFTLQFADGSFGTIHYLANGNRALPKERLEIFCEGKVIQIENYRRMRAFGFRGFRKLNLWRQDRGHIAEVSAFVEAIRRQAASPIPFEEAVETTCVSFDVVESAKQGKSCLYPANATYSESHGSEPETLTSQRLVHPA